MKAKTMTKPVQAKSTKQSQLIALMKRQDGATIGEMTKITGWQPHSVRGVIAGQLKKKLGLTIATTKGTYGTVYRIEQAGK